MAGLHFSGKENVMNKNLLMLLALFSLSTVNVQAAIVTFDTLVSGATSFGYDGDGDTINDVIFSTGDPDGFNTVGPGANMSYINEPGLEGTTLLVPDLRVDFLNGAVTNLGFGFAASGGGAVTFSVFDSGNNLLNSIVQLSAFTLPNGTNPSSFPEALVSLNFSGIAAYALFDFDQEMNRFIIDNFTGTFGSTEDITPNAVPIPAAAFMFAPALLGFMGFRRRAKNLAA